MTTLRNTVTEPDGTALDGWFDVAVVGSPFRTGTQSEVLGPIKDRMFTGGAWSVDLAPGLYVVTQRRRTGAFHSRWTAQLPDSTSPVWLADCLVDIPGTPASMALLGIAAADVDEAGHLQLTYTDGTVVDAGAVAGPPGSGSAADATPTTKGVVQLAGDLGGTAAAPTVPGLSGKANVSHTHLASQVSDSSTVGRAVMTATDVAAARTAIGAGTGNGNVSGTGLSAIQVLTQAAYDGLGTKVATTLYVIQG